MEGAEHNVGGPLGLGLDVETTLSIRSGYVTILVVAALSAGLAPAGDAAAQGCFQHIRNLNYSPTNCSRPSALSVIAAGTRPNRLCRLGRARGVLISMFSRQFIPP